jgi:hypothetical protein
VIDLSEQQDGPVICDPAKGNNLMKIKSKHEKTIDTYNLNPNICKYCGNNIYAKYSDNIAGVKEKQFCNSSCACTYNNYIRKRNIIEKPHCSVCGKQVSKNRTRCIACANKEIKTINKKNKEELKEIGIQEFEKTHCWNIQKTARKSGYLYAVVKEHPKANEHGYVLLHRVIMENEIGRILNDDEVVHHINFDVQDNRPENLIVLSKSDHNNLHAKLKYPRGPEMVELVCRCCGATFTRLARVVKRDQKLHKNVYCSKTCGAKSKQYL